MKAIKYAILASLLTTITFVALLLRAQPNQIPAGTIQIFPETNNTQQASTVTNTSCNALTNKITKTK